MKAKNPEPTGGSVPHVCCTTPSKYNCVENLTPVAPVPLYVDWAVVNNGTGATGVRFSRQLQVDGGVQQTWGTDPPMGSGFFAFIQDYTVGPLSAGTHTLRLVTDSSGVIAESNEGDNQYTKTITVSGGGGGGTPNLTSFQPSGWSDK